jgi:hypothetical protein
VIGFWRWERPVRTTWRHQIETAGTLRSARSPSGRQSTVIRIMVPHGEALLAIEVVGKMVFTHLGG